MSADADVAMEPEAEGPEELTLWSDDHLENVSIYHCSKYEQLLFSSEALAALDAILYMLKSGVNVNSLGQYLVTTCLYASRAREDISKPLYIFDDTSYPKTNFVNAPKLDFTSLISSSKRKLKQFKGLWKYHNELSAIFAKDFRRFTLAAYVGFIAGVLLRCIVKKPKTILSHIHSKMNKAFNKLYYCTSSWPKLPITERDLNVIQAHIKPSCLWMKTLIFYSIGSCKIHSLTASQSTMNNFHVFDAMFTNDFRYYRLNLVYLCLALMYRYSFDKLREALIVNPKVKPAIDKLGIFMKASYGRDESRFMLLQEKAGNKSIYWPYCRIFDRKYFKELNSKDNLFLEMTFIKLLPSIDKEYEWPEGDFEEVKSFAATALWLLRGEELMRIALIIQSCRSATGKIGEQQSDVEEDFPEEC